MAGHRPDFEDRSQIKRQKRGMAHTDEPRDDEEDLSGSADEDGGGVPVSSYQPGKQVKLEGRVSSISSKCHFRILHFRLQRSRHPPLPLQLLHHLRKTTMRPSSPSSFCMRLY